MWSDTGQPITAAPTAVLIMEITLVCLVILAQPVPKAFGGDTSLDLLSVPTVRPWVRFVEGARQGFVVLNSLVVTKIVLLTRWVTSAGRGWLSVVRVIVVVSLIVLVRSVVMMAVAAVAAAAWLERFVKIIVVF